MKKRRVPMRTCVVTNEVLPKDKLIRIAATKDGIVTVDRTGKALGRGAYLKLDKEVINKAKKSRALSKRLRTAIPDEIYEQLGDLLDE